MDDVLDALGRLPADVVTRDRDIVAAYTTDFRRQYAGQARALLRPRSTEQVQAIVRILGGAGAVLVPQGGNTGYCTAATPDRNGEEFVLSLERMRAVREIDPINLSLTADAGAILGDLQDAAAAADLLLPLGLGSQHSCRIGGNVSTNAGGLSVLRYGMTRDLVLGLEVVLADGNLFSDLNPLRKDNAGYDVKQLFVGAEGTLGVITGVSLKLAPRPQQTVTAFLAVRDLDALATLLAQARIYSGESITSFEYVSHASLALLLRARPGARAPLTEAPHYVLMEAATASPVLNLEETVTSLLGAQMESGLILDGAVAASGQQRAGFWALREGLPEGEVHHGGSIKHDVSVRLSRLPAFIERACALVRARAPDAVLSVYGHVGDGNVHFNVLAPAGADVAAYKARIEAEISPDVHALAVEMGGSFSAEYGIGRVKLALLERHGDPGKLDLMRRLKAALDPRDILNRGKVVPPRPS